MTSTNASGSGSTASVQVPASPLPTATLSSTATTATTKSVDTCTWYADRNCSQPRSCFDCLNVAVSEDQCALGPRGECVTKAAYEDYMDTRKSTYLYAPEATYYLSENATYCSASDTTCASCKAQWLKDYASGRSLYSIPLCTGSNGCVCLAACELPNWQVIVTDAQCVASASDSSSLSSNDFLLGAGYCVAMVVAFTLISMGVGKLVRKTDSSNAAAARQRRDLHRGLPVRVPSGPQLSLAGWTSMREKLMQGDDGANGPGASLAPPIVVVETLRR
ncbi:hypothetical protein FI667_g11519, partial [Globisporangium splendens]